MKRQLSSLLRAVAASTSLFWAAGCETEADDAAATNVPPAKVAAAAGSTNTVSTTAASLADGTNVVSTVSTNSATGTNITNNQTVILNKVDPTIPANLKLSKGVEEVVKLAQSGVSETVMLLFVEKSAEAFDLDAAEIVYLNDIGVPQTVIAAMLNHDGLSPELAEKAAASGTTNSVAQAPPVPATGLGGAITPQPAPQTVEVSSNYVADPNYQAPVVQQQPVVVQQPVIVQQPVYVEPAVTHSYFYSSLAPYGTWVEVADYGWCWQPTISVAHRGWRPYAHGGRWLYSSHGWYWHSDYSWGWAPFHYGRWYAAPRHGWVWVPDYTWGPSWVTWRYSGSYCGWAPLPPRCDVRPGVGFRYWDRDVGFSFSFGLSHEHYTFVPTRRFADRRPIDHVVPTDKTVNIYKDSTVVNNYIVGNNNTIINNGVSRDRIASHTQSEIPRVEVRETPGTDSAARPDRLQRNGDQLVVYRPTTPPTATLASSSGRRFSEEARRGTATGAGATAPVTADDTTSSRSRFGQEARRGSSGSIAAASSSSSRETVRPEVTSRTAPPELPKPEPIRPEPTPAYTPRVARAAQEIRTQSASSAAAGETVRSRFGNTDAGATPQRQSSRFSGSLADSTRPATPSSATGTPGSSGTRSEPTRASRFGSQPTMPPSISAQATPGTTTPTITANNSRFSATAMPPSISGQSVPGAAAPAQTVTPTPASRFGAPSRFGSTAPAMPPSISGQAVPGSSSAAVPGSQTVAPVPSSRFGSRFGSAAPATPLSISGQEVPGAATRSESRFGNSDLARQTVTVPTPTVTPAVQGSSRFGNSSSFETPGVSRGERFNRPSVPTVQSAPPVIRPAPVVPSISQPAPSSRFGGGSPNVVPSAPSRFDSGAASGGSRFGGGLSSAPSAPPPVIQRAPSQPSSPPPSSSGGDRPSGRGRIEIGR